MYEIQARIHGGAIPASPKLEKGEKKEGKGEKKEGKGEEKREKTRISALIEMNNNFA